MVKNLHANAGDTGDLGSVPGWGRSPGGGNDNPLQYSYLDNLMDRGAWRTLVHGVAKSRIESILHTYACVYISLSIYIYTHTYLNIDTHT